MSRPGPSDDRFEPQAVGRAFDRLARRHDRARREGLCASGVDAVVEQWLHEVAAARCGVALDLGAGSGIEAVVLVERGWTVDVVDVSVEMLKVATEHLGSSSRVRIVHADLMTFLQAETTAADLVLVAGETLCYLEDPSAAVTAIARRLAMGGSIIGSVFVGGPVGTDGECVVLERPGLFIRSIPEPVLRTMVEATGLAVEVSRPAGSKRAAFRAVRR